MTSSELRRALALPLLVAAACGGGSSSRSLSPGGPNVVPIAVNGAGCSSNQYAPNEPCVSVKVCVPGTSSCQTIDDVLLDTGSTGLRVFSQALTLPLTPVPAPVGGTLAECVAYLDGSSQWGSVVSADVVLGGEPAVTVPVHLLDAAFASSGRPSACSAPDAGPGVGFNGILGVNQWDLDCGPSCVGSGNANNGYYFGCTGSTCMGSDAPPTSQVRNPVAAQPLDNNGVIVQLPAVPFGGLPALTGQLVLGIGTRTNNGPPSGGVVALPLDPNTGLFQATIEGGTPGLESFLDTGSNGIFFATGSTSIPTCPSPDASWYCPPSTVTVNATAASTTGSPSVSVQFQIESLQGLGQNPVGRVGGPAVGTRGYVDFGLPFHFGRDVYVVIEGRPSRFGAGPMVAY